MITFTTMWLQALNTGDRVMIKDILNQQEYPATVLQRLGRTLYVQEDNPVKSRVDGEWPFDVETGKNIQFLGESFLRLVPLV